MSSRPKALLKQGKTKHKKEQTLNTANDYQAAGVDFEDAAGKWRGGDAVKSMRFFNRALEVYQEGLQRFPQSFDLAYNKARVQLELATHPILVKQLQEPVITVLQAALQSHRYALGLNQDNPDTLFNTAQVLTSIAEEIAKDDALDDADGVRLLEESLELQERCLSLQEMKFEESQQQQQEASLQQNDASASIVDEDDEDGGVALKSSQEPEDQWFSIVEAITQDTLIDTALAQLGTLTTLCGILSNSPAAAPQATLAWIEEYSTKILTKKLPFFVSEGSERLSEIALIKANFISALLDAGFRAGRLDAETYKRERDGAFSVPELQLQTSSEALIANARSLISFNAGLADASENQRSTLTTARWNALSAAITILLSASKISGVSPEDLATTHMLRGDCSLLQYQMSQAPSLYPSAVSNAAQLLKNALVFYRNVSKLSPDNDEKNTAGFRSSVAQYLQQGDTSNISSANQGQGEAWMVGQIEDMILEGLLPVGFQF